MMKGLSVPYLVYSTRQEKARWTDATDLELLQALRRDDETAFDVLIERKSGPLLGLAQRMLGDREEARDIVQLALLRVWENRHGFKEKWSPNTWLYRITTNLAIDRLRSRHSRNRLAEPVRHHMLRVAHGQGRHDLASLQEREVAHIFERLSSCLTQRQRTVFLLRGVEGLSSGEVGAILGCRASTVRNHLFTARRKLRRELLRLYPEYMPGNLESENEDGVLR